LPRIEIQPLVISLNLVLAGLRLGLKNRQVGKKWIADVKEITHWAKIGFC
jgi:hypothetical protein